MNFTEIIIEINVADVEVVGNIITMAVPYGFYIEDYSDLEQGAREIANIDLIDQELLNKDRTKALLHIYISPTDNPNEVILFLQERLDTLKIRYKITTGKINEQDWANNWKQYFKPTKIGEKLLILPSWEQLPDTRRKVLKIDPGAAFGTGTHATTKLCLKSIEKYVDPGMEVLDVGCGSGILSIAALLLGARSSVGVDIDELAVKTATENGKLNGFEKTKFTVLNGDLIDKVKAKFDVCVANIVADVIIKLSENIVKFLKDDGVFIASGIIDDRLTEVSQAIKKHGLEIIEESYDAGWVCIVAKLKGEI